MNTGSGTLYYDRRDGRLKRETVHAARFLGWAHNSRTGRWASDLMFSQKWFSSLYGWLHRQRWSRRKIGTFVRRFEVDVGELVKPLGSFSSFHDFFIREIDLSRRGMETGRGACIAPADGKAMVFPFVHPERTFQIKRNVFNLRRFLDDGSLADLFALGSMAVIRLSLSDYHHFHFPDSGVPDEPVSVPGKYHAGGSHSIKRPIPFFTENHRMITTFDSDHFGPLAIVEVGAMTVGSIRQRFQPGRRVNRGDRKGNFELGGSTVVLLFAGGRIEFDVDLCANSRHGIETLVRFGDSIGQVPKGLPYRRGGCHGEGR